MKRSSEPFWWALFGAGGVLSAMFVPVLLLVTGLLIPMGIVQVPHESLLELSDNLLFRLFATAIISLSLFHWAHRFRFTLYDGLQLKHLNALIAILCYGTAIVGSVLAVLFVLIG